VDSARVNRQFFLIYKNQFFIYLTTKHPVFGHACIQRCMFYLCVSLSCRYFSSDYLFSLYKKKYLRCIRKLYRISTMLISRAAIQQLQLLQERYIIYKWKSYLSEIRRKKYFLKRRTIVTFEVKNYISYLMSTHRVTRFPDAYLLRDQILTIPFRHSAIAEILPRIKYLS